MYTIAPHNSFFTSIKTCTVDGLGWLSTYTCVDGYVPLTLASNVKNADYKIGGCYSCAGTSGTDSAVNTDPTTLYDNTGGKCTAPTDFTATLTKSFIDATNGISTATLTGCASGAAL